jgi:hypothetical protein
VAGGLTSGTWALYTVILKRCPQNFVQSEWGDIYDTRRVRMDGWAEESKNAKRLDESYVVHQKCQARREDWAADERDLESLSTSPHPCSPSLPLRCFSRSVGVAWQGAHNLVVLVVLVVSASARCPGGHESTMARGKACRPCPALPCLPCPPLPLGGPGAEPWLQSPDRGGLGGPVVGAQRHGHQRERWDVVRQARGRGGEEAEGGPTG